MAPKSIHAPLFSFEIMKSWHMTPALCIDIVKNYLAFDLMLSESFVKSLI
jgi:hypothetical protein